MLVKIHNGVAALIKSGKCLKELDINLPNDPTVSTPREIPRNEHVSTQIFVYKLFIRASFKKPQSGKVHSKCL